MRRDGDDKRPRTVVGTVRQQNKHVHEQFGAVAAKHGHERFQRPGLFDPLLIEII
jgi:hypothetical protein